MNILLIGSGAREHIIAKSLKKSKHDVTLFTFGNSKNPGIIKLSQEYYVGDICDPESVLEFAKTNAITFAIIGPEAPIDAGVADILESSGIPTIAPTKKLGQLESSKGFTRALLEKYGIHGNPKYKAFTGTVADNHEALKAFLESLEENFVVKYDALYGGKGVKLSGEHLFSLEEGLEYAEFCLRECGRVVIEEKLEGEEFSLIGMTDGDTIIEFPPIQDHKRAYDGDQGPNTGGMGTYSDADHLLPFLRESDIKEAHTINLAVLDALQKECGERYKGVLYGGFIATKSGVRLIEYNARFGDPEIFNILNLLENDFVDICLAIINNTLSEVKLMCKPKASVCRYIVPEGYPDAPIKGGEVILGKISDAIDVSFASVEERDGKLVTLGSRAIALTAVANTLKEAAEMLDTALTQVSGAVFFRKDIGTPDLIAKRITHMEKLRGE